MEKRVSAPPKKGLAKAPPAPCWKGQGDAVPYLPGLPEEVPRFRSLSALFEQMACCTRCDLAPTRTQVVPGIGPRRADLMLIGEGPGANEDKQGRPFIGRGGRLLDSLLAEAGVERADVFITNVVACRPPGNRTPRPAEVRAHAPWLEEQIRLVAPRVIVTLGRAALTYFLPKEKITLVHGVAWKQERHGKELWILPTFHPAAALRNDELRPLMQADLLKLGELLEA